MPAVVDRRIGFHKPMPRVGDTYPDGIAEYLSKIGRVPSTWSIFLGFDVEYPGKAGAKAPHTDYDRAVTVYGMDLLIGFQPSIGYFPDGTFNSAGKPNYPARWATFADIIAGVYDPALTTIATHYASLRKPDGTAPRVRWRIVWEGNQTFSVWFPADSPNKPTSMQATGTNLSTGFPVTPGRPWTDDAGTPVCASVAQYRAGFDHMADVIHAAASNNEVWYIPGATDARAELDRGAAGATAANMLPTLSKLDGVGHDKYSGLDSVWVNAGDTIKGYRPNDLTDAEADARGVPRITRAAGAATPYSTAYDLWKAIAPGKPQLVAEINACEPGDPKGGPSTPFNKPAWYTELWALPASFAPEIVDINFFDAPGTRTTWPIDSSTPAFEAFVAGYTTRTASSTWTASTPWTPPDDGDFVPADSRWLTDEPVFRQGGASKAITTILRWLRSFTYVDPTSGKVALRAKTDGSVVGLRVTAGMGTLPLGQYVPALDLVGPAPVSGTRKWLMAMGEQGEASKRLQCRSDGRFAWTGGSGSADLNLFRSAAGTLAITGASDGAATLSVDSAAHSSVKISDSATQPASPGSNVFNLYSYRGVPMARTGSGNHPLIRRTAADIVAASWPARSIEPELYITTTSGPAIAPGTALVAVAPWPWVQALSRLGMYLQTAGAGLSGCFVSAYDSAGVLLACTTDQATAWQGSAGLKSQTTGLAYIGSAPSTAPSSIYLMLSCAAATTNPRVLGASNTGANAFGLRFATLATAGWGSPVSAMTGVTGAPPASFSPGDLVQTASAWVVAAG